MNTSRTYSRIYTKEEVPNAGALEAHKLTNMTQSRLLQLHQLIFTRKKMIDRTFEKRRVKSQAAYDKVWAYYSKRLDNTRDELELFTREREALQMESKRMKLEEWIADFRKRKAALQAEKEQQKAS